MLTCWHAETVAQRHVHTDKTLTTWHADVFTCWRAGTLTLTCWNSYYLTRWDADMVIYRLEDTLTCWHFDMLTGWCACRPHWLRHPEDTLMLTFWHNDMQTSRHGDLLTGCWRANMLTCRYANVQARWCWHTDLLLLTADMLACQRRADMWLGWRANMVTCRYANVQTRWQAGLLTCWHWNVQTRWHVDILSHWNADKGTVWATLGSLCKCAVAFTF